MAISFLPMWLPPLDCFRESSRCNFQQECITQVQSKSFFEGLSLDIHLESDKCCLRSWACLCDAAFILTYEIPACIWLCLMLLLHRLSWRCSMWLSHSLLIVSDQVSKDNQSFKLKGSLAAEAHWTSRCQMRQAPCSLNFTVDWVGQRTSPSMSEL